MKKYTIKQDSIKVDTGTADVVVRPIAEYATTIVINLDGQQLSIVVSPAGIDNPTILIGLHDEEEVD